MSAPVRNWQEKLFICNTAQGAHSSAIILRIAETAKEIRLQPIYYLTYLIEKSPRMDTKDNDQLDHLLHWSAILSDIFHVPRKNLNQSIKHPHLCL